MTLGPRSLDFLDPGGFQQGLRAAMGDIDQWMAEATGAKSAPVEAAARLLVKETRRLVGGMGEEWETAAPGEPPLAHQRRLYRSIQTAVVDGERRVGSGYFVARLLEFGTDGDERGPDFPHPFMRPALEGVADQMTDVFVSDLQRRSP